mmetsp:Transcript_21329/g.45258  ORF Transcript_21329/g.45258 Transcript_21329/m.45258 type:complete len:181 (+) Transcript_21329:2-544(+)
MTIQAESFWTKQWGQEADTDRLQAKYDEKKFLKRKRPRPSASGTSGNNRTGKVGTSSRKSRKKMDIATLNPADLLVNDNDHVDANLNFVDANRHAQDHSDTRRILPLHYNINANNAHQQRHTLFPHSFEQHSLQHPHAYPQPNNTQLRHHHPQYPPHHQRQQQQQQHPEGPYVHHTTYPL